ncbi:MAG: hypothetical protein EOP02_14815 [Proteobacteria bacterium]|nr:MAG: hypothetical protein EOP02_14815 [Pseudomonadota bacterium]
MKFGSLPLLAACLFVATPLSAQAETEDAAAAEIDASGMMDMFANMFGQAPELSAEAQARVPVAKQVVDLIFPEGAYAQLMETTLGSMSEGLFQGLAEPARATSVARLTGLGEFELIGMEDATLDAAIAVLDPVYDQRAKVVMDVTTSETTAMMSAIEPSYREGLANAYADRFTADQLAELMVFFQTPTGGYYAAQSMQIYADPHVMARMNEMFPIMMERIPLMTQRMEEAMAALPAERYFDQLDAQEKASLAELLGRSEEELEASVAAARAAETPVEDSDWDDLMLEDAVADEVGPDELEAERAD